MTWEKAKQTYEFGQEIEGTVIKKNPFGDFLEVVPEQEFTVLIQIVDIKDLTPEIYQSGNYTPIGTKVKGKIVDFRDYNTQIVITQK